MVIGLLLVGSRNRAMASSSLAVATLKGLETSLRLHIPPGAEALRGAVSFHLRTSRPLVVASHHRAVGQGPAGSAAALLSATSLAGRDVTGSDTTEMLTRVAFMAFCCLLKTGAFEGRGVVFETSVVLDSTGAAR